MRDLISDPAAVWALVLVVVLPVVIIGAAERWCRLAPELLQPPASRRSEIPGIELGWTTSPYPVVAVISPWNFPLILTLIDAVPALAAGCAVLAKASKVTPRFVEPLAETIDEYRRDMVPIIAPLTLLRHHLRRIPDAYLKKQSYQYHDRIPDKSRKWDLD